MTPCGAAAAATTSSMAGTAMTIWRPLTAMVMTRWWGAMAATACWAAVASYGQCWCSASGGDLLLGRLHGFAVTEANALDQLGEPVRPVQVAPVALGRFGE